MATDDAHNTTGEGTPRNNNTPQEGAGADGSNGLESENEGSLKALNKKLYSRKEPEEFEKRRLQLGSSKEVGRVTAHDARNVHDPDLVDTMQKKAKTRKKLIRWSILVTSVIVVFIASVVATLVYRQSQQVTKEHMNISIDTPEQFTAGEQIEYVLSYSNDSRVAWLDVEIIFRAPNGFRLHSSTPDVEQSGQRYIASIGELNAGEGGEVRLTGQLLGEENTTALAGAELVISPENFPKARRSNSKTVSTTIAGVPIEISVEAANNPAEGERLRAEFRVRNTSSVPIDGVLLRLSPDPGIQVATEDEQFSPGFSAIDSWWELPRLEPLDEATRTAVFYVEGTPGERRSLEIVSLVRDGEDLYTLREVQHVFTVSASELSVNQTFNGKEDQLVVHASDEITGQVEYKNVGTTGLSNVVAKVQFEGTGLDPSTLDLKSGGAYDPDEKSITWTAASVPNLNTLLPGQGGVLEYDFAILPSEGFSAEEDGKNQSLVVTATIDSPDLPTPVGQERKVISNRFAIPITTDLSLEVDSFYDDGRLGLESKGPIPPEVGELTTYTVRLRLGSTLNDVGDVQVNIVLPDSVSYRDEIYKTTGDVSFNERTQQVTWSIPTIDGLSGRAAPAPELHMQVGITPGENLRGQEVDLVQSVNVEALDLFTDETVTARIERRELPDTGDAVPREGEVQ